MSVNLRGPDRLGRKNCAPTCIASAPYGSMTRTLSGCASCRAWTTNWPRSRTAPLTACANSSIASSRNCFNSVSGPMSLGCGHCSSWHLRRCVVPGPRVRGAGRVAIGGANKSGQIVDRGNVSSRHRGVYRIGDRSLQCGRHKVIIIPPANLQPQSTFRCVPRRAGVW